MARQGQRVAGASRKVTKGGKQGKSISKMRVSPQFLHTFAVALVIGLMGYGGVRLFERIDDQPIQDVEVVGDFAFVSRKRLMEVLTPRMGETFVRVDLLNLKAELEKEVWIDYVAVKRVWPATLRITVIEQRPIARWGRGNALNLRGEVIPVEDPELMKKSLAHLPLLIGPAGTEQMVMANYHKLREQLSEQDLVVTALRLDRAQTWSMTINGTEFVAGREQLTDRINRFIKAYDQYLKQRWPEVRSIDLRYANGLAVSWAENFN